MDFLLDFYVSLSVLLYMASNFLCAGYCETKQLYVRFVLFFCKIYWTLYLAGSEVTARLQGLLLG